MSRDFAHNVIDFLAHFRMDHHCLIVLELLEVREILLLLLGIVEITNDLLRLDSFLLNIFLIVSLDDVQFKIMRGSILFCTDRADNSSILFDMLDGLSVLFYMHFNEVLLHV